MVMVSLAGSFKAASWRFAERPIRQPDARENLERPEHGRPPYAGELSAQALVDGFRCSMDMSGGEMAEDLHPLGRQAQARSAESRRDIVIETHVSIVS